MGVGRTSLTRVKTLLLSIMLIVVFIDVHWFAETFFFLVKNGYWNLWSAFLRFLFDFSFFSLSILWIHWFLNAKRTLGRLVFFGENHTWSWWIILLTYFYIAFIQLTVVRIIACNFMRGTYQKFVFEIFFFWFRFLSL